MRTFGQYIFEMSHLNEEVSDHHRAAIQHGYRSGTFVGTTGYYTQGGGFTHVYHHPKQKHEVHIHTAKSGKVDKWVHVSDKNIVHRVGVESKELRNHLREFHPEVAEAAAKKKMTKEKQEMDKVVAKKQGRLIDKMVNSSKLPSISLNVGASAMKPKTSATKKKKK